MGDRLGIPGAVSCLLPFYNSRGSASSLYHKCNCILPCINTLCSPTLLTYGHTTVNTPDLVWSRKLSKVVPGQYLDGKLPGNTRCCKLFILHFQQQGLCSLFIPQVSLHFTIYKYPVFTFSSGLWPFHTEQTGSRLILEAKQSRAGSVLGWGTTWEYLVL